MLSDRRCWAACSQTQKSGAIFRAFDTGWPPSHDEWGPPFPAFGRTSPALRGQKGLQNKTARRLLAGRFRTFKKRKAYSALGASGAASPSAFLERSSPVS